MRLALLFARRYLLAKRSRNAINVITLISIVVIAVVTAAMVVVLSTLNGISDLVDKLYSPFDQDVTITPVTGKSFPRDSLALDRIRALPGVRGTSWTIEENVLLRSGEQQAVATMKGVEPQYLDMASLPESMYDGEARLHGNNGPLVILGAALKDQLGVPRDDGVMRPLTISAPVRGRKLLRYKEQAFGQEHVAVAGSFSINMEFDQQYVIGPITLMDSLLRYGGEVSALEVKARPGIPIEELAVQVARIAGPRFTTLSRYAKNSLMYRTNATEKWFTFAVLAFIVMIGAFNIIASLALMMIEKQQDMRTLTGMGATAVFVRRIFFAEGLLIVAVGSITGLVLGLFVCAIQIRTGIVGLANSVVESYPVRIVPADIALIFLTVLFIGMLATAISLRGLGQRYLMER